MRGWKIILPDVTHSTNASAAIANAVRASGTQGLVRWDPASARPEDRGVVPALATSWTTSIDPVSKEYTITFQLRRGVKFHDGTEWNADAAALNFGHVMGGPDRALGPSFHDWFALSVRLMRWRAVSNFTFSLTFDSEYEPALRELCLVRPFRMISPASLPDLSAGELSCGRWFNLTFQGARTWNFNNQTYRCGRGQRSRPPGRPAHRSWQRRALLPSCSSPGRRSGSGRERGCCCCGVPAPGQPSSRRNLPNLTAPSWVLLRLRLPKVAPFTSAAPPHLDERQPCPPVVRRRCRGIRAPFGTGPYMADSKLLSDGRSIGPAEFNSTCRLTSGCNYGFPGVVMADAVFVRNPSALPPLLLVAAARSALLGGPTLGGRGRTGCCCCAADERRCFWPEMKLPPFHAPLPRPISFVTRPRRLVGRQASVRQTDCAAVQQPRRRQAGAHGGGAAAPSDARGLPQRGPRCAVVLHAALAVLRMLPAPAGARLVMTASAATPRFLTRLPPLSALPLAPCRPQALLDGTLDMAYGLSALTVSDFLSIDSQVRRRRLRVAEAPGDPLAPPAGRAAPETSCIGLPHALVTAMIPRTAAAGGFRRRRRPSSLPVKCSPLAVAHAGREPHPRCVRLQSRSEHAHDRHEQPPLPEARHARQAQARHAEHRQARATIQAPARRARRRSRPGRGAWRCRADSGRRLDTEQRSVWWLLWTYRRPPRLAAVSGRCRTQGCPPGL